MRFRVIWQTDTASVLWEAIGYIKFLQEQVQVIALLNTVVMFIYILAFELVRVLRHIFI